MNVNKLTGSVEHASQTGSPDAEPAASPTTDEPGGTDTKGPETLASSVAPWNTAVVDIADTTTARWQATCDKQAFICRLFAKKRRRKTAKPAA